MQGTVPLISFTLSLTAHPAYVVNNPRDTARSVNPAVQWHPVLVCEHVAHYRQEHVYGQPVDAPRN
jgi:hypothetical protein